MIFTGLFEAPLQSTACRQRRLAATFTTFTTVSTSPRKVSFFQRMFSAPPCHIPLPEAPPCKQRLSRPHRDLSEASSEMLISVSSLAVNRLAWLYYCSTEVVHFPLFGIAARLFPCLRLPPSCIACFSFRFPFSPIRFHIFRLSSFGELSLLLFFLVSFMFSICMFVYNLS